MDRWCGQWVIITLFGVAVTLDGVSIRLEDRWGWWFHYDTLSCRSLDFVVVIITNLLNDLAGPILIVGRF